MTKDEPGAFSARLVTAIEKKLEEDLHQDVRCSFCAKPEADVADMVAGATAYICNECVSKCAEVMRERGLEI